MATARNADGTIDVRVVLSVKVDPDTWATDMMGEHPDEVLVTEVRRHVKAYVESRVAVLPLSPSDFGGTDENPTPVPIRSVGAEGIYPTLQEV